MTEPNNTNPQDGGTPQAQPSQTPDQGKQPAATQPQSGQQPAAQQPANPFAQPQQGQQPTVQSQPRQGAPQPPLQFDPNNPRQYEPNRRPDADVGLSAGMKFLWVILGFFLDIFSFVLVFIMYSGPNRDPRVRSQALKWCLVGFVISIIASMALYSYLGPDGTMQFLGYNISQNGVTTSTGSAGSAGSASSTGSAF